MTKIVIRKPEALQLTSTCYYDPTCGVNLAYALFLGNQLPTNRTVLRHRPTRR